MGGVGRLFLLKMTLLIKFQKCLIFITFIIHTWRSDTENFNITALFEVLTRESLFDSLNDLNSIIILVKKHTNILENMKHRIRSIGFNNEAK